MRPLLWKARPCLRACIVQSVEEGATAFTLDAKRTAQGRRLRKARRGVDGTTRLPLD